MSKIVIKPSGQGHYSVVLDGFELAPYLAADRGVVVSFAPLDDDGPVVPTVRLTLAPGVILEADFPDALADLIRERQPGGLVTAPLVAINDGENVR